MACAAIDREQADLAPVVEFLQTISAFSHWTPEQRRQVALAALEANEWQVSAAKLAIVAAFIERLDSVLPPREYYGSGG